jgi:hypothetical protein
MRNVTKLYSKDLKGKDHSEDLREDGRIILKRISKRQGVRMWTGFIWLRIGTCGGIL